MRAPTRFTLAAVFVVGLGAVTYAGCDGVSSIADSACSSCQVAYTSEQCKKWGDLAGCETAVVEPSGSCSASLAGCSFTNCSGAPICDDLGGAECAGEESLTQADCDTIAKTASCTSAMTGDFQVGGKSVTGCHFEGCHFTPDCP